MKISRIDISEAYHEMRQNERAGIRSPRINDILIKVYAAVMSGADIRADVLAHDDRERFAAALQATASMKPVEQMRAVCSRLSISRAAFYRRKKRLA